MQHREGDVRREQSGIHRAASQEAPGAEGGLPQGLHPGQKNCRDFHQVRAQVRAHPGHAGDPKPRDTGQGHSGAPPQAGEHGPRVLDRPQEEARPVQPVRQLRVQCQAGHRVDPRHRGALPQHSHARRSQRRGDREVAQGARRVQAQCQGNSRKGLPAHPTGGQPHGERARPCLEHQVLGRSCRQEIQGLLRPNGKVHGQTRGTARIHSGHE